MPDIQTANSYRSVSVSKTITVYVLSSDSFVDDFSTALQTWFVLT